MRFSDYVAFILLAGASRDALFIGSIGVLYTWAGPRQVLVHLCSTHIHLCGKVDFYRSSVFVLHLAVMHHSYMRQDQRYRRRKINDIGGAINDIGGTINER
ncbi:hypothetical protein F5X99DRAFT_11887 [Biscogniauxia marginata]|nr:hypothetical protein F5X99DRAFT_11887 [Biscogniauxia marginata]